MSALRPIEPIDIRPPMAFNSHLLAEGLYAMRTVPRERMAHERLQAAEKFTFAGLPSDLLQAGHDYAEDLLRHLVFSLPFPSCYFEFSSEQARLQPRGRAWATLAWWERENVLGVRGYILDSDGGVVTGGGSGFLGTGMLNVGVRRHMVDDPAVSLGPNATKADLDTRANECVAMAFFFVFCAVGLLASKGLRHEKAEAPVKLNAARLKKGKPPLDSYRRVLIDLDEVRKASAETDENRSPTRLHWRRGHVRRLPSGMLTKVRPCLVGDPALGVVRHDYNLRSSFGGANWRSAT